MNVKTIVTTTLLVTVFFLTGTSSNIKAECQEGVLHKVVRSVFQIPVTLFKSLQGPTCQNDLEYKAKIRYPDSNTVFAPQYKLNSPEVYAPLPKTPEYVTYKIVPQQLQKSQSTKKANFHVYSSIPFSNR